MKQYIQIFSIYNNSLAYIYWNLFDRISLMIRAHFRPSGWVAISFLAYKSDKSTE